MSLACLGVLSLTGCGGGPEPENRFGATGTAPEDLYEWFGEGLTGPTKVVLDLSQQRAEIFIGGEYAGWTSVATGKAGYGTPAGEYKIVEKVADKHSTLYGKIVDAEGTTVNPDADIRKDKVPRGFKFVHAPMPNWMRLTWTGIGMHAGPIPQPGTPASHGCIRLPDEMSEILFRITRIGTPVTIIGEAPTPY